MNFFYDRIPPQSHDSTYVSKKPGKVLGVVSYTNPVSQWVVTHLFFFHPAIQLKGETTVNVSSVARYICDAYFSGLDKGAKNKKLTDIKAIVKENAEAIVKNKTNKNIGLDDFIKSIVTNLAKEEKVAAEEDKSETSVAEIVEKALKPPENLQEAKKFEALFEKLSLRSDLLRPKLEYANKLHSQVEYLTCQNSWKELLNKSSKELPESLKDYKISLPPSTLDYPSIEENLKILKTYCELKQQLNKEYMIHTNKNWINAEKKLNEIEDVLSTAFEENSSCKTPEFNEIQPILTEAALESLKDNILASGKKEGETENKDLADLEKTWKNLKEAELEKALKTRIDIARERILKTYTIKSTQDDTEHIEKVMKMEKPNAALVEAALTLQEEKIIQIISSNGPLEQINAEVEIFGKLVEKCPETFAAAIKNLLARTKEATEKVVSCLEKHTHPLPENILQTKEPPPEMYKIIALRNNAEIAMRLEAASLYVQKKPGEIETFTSVLVTALNTKELKDLEILKDIPATTLKEIFKQNRFIPLRERLREMTCSIKEINLQARVAEALSFNLQPIQPTEEWIDSTSRNIIVLETPLSGSVAEYRSSLAREISRLRETDVAKTQVVHALAIGGQGNFTAKNLEKFWEILDDLQKLSADFRGVTLIPGRISLLSPKMEIVPIFEDGRLIHIGGNPLLEGNEDVAKRLSLFFLSPNGTSMALGVGDAPLLLIRDNQEALPANSHLLDCEVAIETGERDATPPAINTSGLLLRVSKDNTIKQGTGISQPEATGARKIGEPPLPNISDYCDEGTNPFKLEENERKLILSMLSKGQTDILAEMERKYFFKNVIKLILSMLLKNQTDILDEMERKYFFKDEEDQTTFKKALKSGLIPPEYTHQFLVLFSKMKGSSHSVIVYTENPSIPVQIYRGGICTSEVKDPQSILPDDNRTLLAYSSKNKAFFPVSKNLLESKPFMTAKDQVNTEWEGHKKTIANALGNVATHAKECQNENSVELLRESLFTTSMYVNKLSLWMSSTKTVADFYWKQNKRRDLESWERAIQTIKEYCTSIVRLPFLKDRFLVEKLTELLEGEKQLSSSLKQFLPPTTVENVMATLTTVPRTWDTIYTLTTLGRSPEKASSLKTQDGRLLLESSAVTTKAEDLHDTLFEIKDILTSLKEKLSEKNINYMRKALKLLTKKTSSQQETGLLGYLQPWKTNSPSWANSSLDAKARLSQTANKISENFIKPKK